MIVAQAIPSSYVNVQTGVTADNPWSPQNLYVYATGAKTFQIWFYNVSYQGCLTLLLQGTACQAGQEGCPTAIYTAGGGGGNMCQPNQSNCPNSSPTYNATNIGWQVATPTIVNTMCGANNYHGGTNSVIFQYTL
jgi:hypothetical protein